MSMDGTYSNVGAVVGATYPEMSKILRKLMPHTYFLVPGYGAQGGTAADLKHCFNEDGLGAIVNSSRGIIAAYRQENTNSLVRSTLQRLPDRQLLTWLLISTVYCN